jgi:hypothetical protein
LEERDINMISITFAIFAFHKERITLREQIKDIMKFQKAKLNNLEHWRIYTISPSTVD